ncbi:hypothetical protein CU098_011555 [Rhizopus stolonifer]|uniref:Uncharacterized protein n=1 Tax=Rhizopus stolonifer TaxID=4846 RepID=A0A367KQF4_RHIST|nr:hypothetical protein CU098_011555 [Rhizopus stolonifer]
MSHEVTDLEPVFEFLDRQDSTSNTSWEESLIVKMLNLCKKYIRSTGKERDGASLLIARLLSRQDLSDEYLIPFIEWSKDKLSNGADVFEISGILQSFCFVYQLAPRQTLLPTLDEHILPLLTMPFFDEFSNNSLVRKLRTKLTQRVGLAYLKPRIAKWRYQRGSRSLKHNLEGDTVTSITSSREDDDEEDDEDISENLEVIIEILLNGLRDKDTIVRWSSAKGIGRITQRLPQELAEDVVSSLLELFEENTFLNKTSNALDLSSVSDSTWHGASLAVAELARRGLLLPERLKETIPWIVKGLKFDIKRGSHSIGAHVRDACCYVCWAFARAYAPEIIRPFVKEIAQNLVIVSVFDREINVRRASSAAFQENVGRQGIFPHGIEIIQMADYFSLGNRNTSFLTIAAEIAKFEEYRYHLIQHLIDVTAKHWDKSMRVLASKALYNLVPSDPSYFIETCLPILVPSATSSDMQISHGALMAIAEISLSLWESNNADIQKSYYQQSALLVPIIPNIPPKSLTTFGSENVREATCHLITCLSKTNLDFDVHISYLKRIVWSSLERKEENVQEVAVTSFKAMTAAYGIEKQEIDEIMRKIEVSNPMFYGRRGFALALGTLDYIKYKDYIHDILYQLCKASQVQQDHQANDAEAKRNSVLGLSQILFELDQNLKKVVSYEDFQYIISSLKNCLTDYSTDQRGDVGSWVRIATMDIIDFLLPCVSKLDRSDESNEQYLTQEITASFVSALLKQSVERIDKVRACAGKVLYNIIFGDEDINIPAKEDLVNSIHRDLNWLAPSDVYPIVVSLLKIPEYRFELLTGLITSAGGLTESLVRHSSTCLIEYMDSLPIEGNTDCSLESLFEVLIDIFVKYEKQDRITIPLLDVAGLLYIGLASLDDSQVRTKAMQQLLSFLVHSFPRIRIEVSDQLFTLLSISEEDYSEAMDLITGTDWTQSLESVKEERDKLYPLLNIPKPVFAKKQTKS